MTQEEALGTAADNVNDSMARSEERLKQIGVAIIEEQPVIQTGSLKGPYTIIGKHMDSGNQFTASGEDRQAALRALVVMALASA